MGNAKFSVFQDDIHADIGTGVALARIEQVAQKVIREFCKETRALWDEETRLIQANVCDYTVVDIDDNVEVADFMQVIVTNRGYEAGKHFERKNSNTVRIVPLTIDIEDGMYLRFSLRPTLAATTFPDELLEYTETLVHGIKGYIFDQAKASWYDSRKANENTALFKAEMLDITDRMSDGGVDSSDVVQIPFFC